MSATLTAPQHRVGAMPTVQQPQPKPATQKAKKNGFPLRLKVLQKKLLALGPQDFLGIVGVNMTTVRKLIPKVVNGIAFWEFHNLDWKAAVRAKKFDMQCEDNCLLAQMTGHGFYDACAQMGLDMETDATRLGVYLGDSLASITNYRILTQLWIHANRLDQN